MVEYCQKEPDWEQYLNALRDLGKLNNLDQIKQDLEDFYKTGRGGLSAEQSAKAIEGLGNDVKKLELASVTGPPTPGTDTQPSGGAGTSQAPGGQEPAATGGGGESPH
jgi:hypothetical protein